jgi:hypothetical protein
MRWRPSLDANVVESNELWQILQTIYDKTLSTAPLTRGNDTVLRYSYVRRRRNDSPHIETLRTLLPKGFPPDLSIGATEIDVLDFILNYTDNRILNLEGPRGVGKTTLVYFIENVLQWTSIAVKPILLVLDGLRLAESEATDSADYIKLIAEEMRYRGVQTDPRLRVLLSQAAEKLFEKPSVDRLMRTLRDLVPKLPTSDPRLITFVFDNLDQLPSNVIRAAADLARRIFASSKMGSILCLRPGSRAGLMKSASARALFNYSAVVEAPAMDAWIERLGERMGNLCKREPQLLGKVVSLNKTLSPAIISQAMVRFAELLATRRYSALTSLEAVSASDTRHLVLLVRRMLSHRSLPVAYLLEGSGDSTFFALQAMVEGDLHAYNSEADKASVVPNLLWTTNSFGGYDFLLLYQLLALLDSGPTHTDVLFGWLSELGFAIADGEQGLAYLVNTILIRGTDKEKFREARLPEAFALTKAGEHYLNHMLSMTDYMAWMVLDVPLPHADVRRLGVTQFAPRIASLAELALEIINAEQAQLERLERRAENERLRHVLERLARTGSLSSALARSLGQAVTRAQASRSLEVHRAGDKATKMVQQLNDWVQAHEARTRLIIQRLRGDSLTVKRDAVVLTSNGVRVELQVDDSGDAFSIAAKVRSSSDVDAVFVAIRSSFGSFTVSSATVVDRSTERRSSGTELLGVFPTIEKEKQITAEALQIQTVSLSGGANRVGLLSIEEILGRFSINLSVVSGGTQKYTLSGPPTSIDEIRHWWTSERGRISSAVAATKPLDETIRVAGVGLTRRLLDENSANILAGQQKLIDTLVIFTHHLDIPWEWLSLTDSSGSPLPIALAWNVLRWPWDRIEGAALTVADFNGNKSALPMVTVGLPKNSAAPWIAGTPRKLEQLQKLARKYRTVHIVGQWDRRHNALVVGSMRLTTDAAGTYPLNGAANVILSVCDDGGAEFGSHLAAYIAAGSRCVTWAPLIALRKRDAARLDSELASYLAARAEKDDTDNEKRVSPLCLYARYGLGGS